MTGRNTSSIYTIQAAMTESPSHQLLKSLKSTLISEGAGVG
jgi:hypothetical protein